MESRHRGRPLTALALGLLAAPAVDARAAEDADAGTDAAAKAAAASPHWSGLPIWGEEAKARGYTIPLPFGVGITAYSAEQPVDIEDLRLGRGPTQESVTHVLQIDRVDTSQKNASVKLDVLVFPFLDVYALVGRTTGSTEGVIEVAEVPGLGLVDRTELLLDASFGGTTWGLGATLQGGKRIDEERGITAMIVADWNRTRTDLEFDNDALVAHTQPEATVFSARVGLHRPFGANRAGAVWLGAMHQDIQHLVSGVVDGTDISFAVVQQPARAWNTLAGGLFEFGPRGYVLVEGGFGTRKSVLVAAVYRF